MQQNPRTLHPTLPASGPVRRWTSPATRHRLRARPRSAIRSKGIETPNRLLTTDDLSDPRIIITEFRSGFRNPDESNREVADTTNFIADAILVVERSKELAAFDHMAEPENVLRSDTVPPTLRTKLFGSPVV